MAAAVAAVTTAAAATAGDRGLSGSTAQRKPWVLVIGQPQGFVLRISSRLPSPSGDHVATVAFNQIVQLILLPFAAAHLADRMGGLQFAFSGFREGATQAAATQLRRPAMETMKVSGPCHEHLWVVTPLV